MSEFKDLKLSELVASTSNPRTEFEENSLNELAESIKEHGVLQPIIVRKHPLQNKKFEVVCGERRFRASKIAGSKTIPVSIRELTDDEVFEIQIIENLERKDVHPMDEAIAFKKMIESGKYTVEEIAAKIAKNETFVAQRLKLNDLIEELQEEFLKGEFGVGHAVLYSRLTIEKQSDIFSNATEGWNQGYGTLKEAKSDLERENEDLDEAIFDTKSEDLIPTAGACINCQKCSSANPVLFPEFEGNFCFDSKCFNLKSQTEKANRLVNVLEDNPDVILVASWNFKDGRLDDIITEAGKKLLKHYDDFSTYGTKGEGVQAWHVDDANYIEIFFKENSKNDAIKSNPGADQNLILEISKIKDRANRALELDREKIYKRALEEIKKVPEKNNIMLSTEPLLDIEKRALALCILCYSDDDWIDEMFGKKLGYNDKHKQLEEIFSEEFLSKLIRHKIQRELISENFMDFVKSDRPFYIHQIFKHYFPQEIQLFTDEQNDVAAKRIERSDKKIKDLEEEIKKSSENREEQKQNLQTVNVCEVCQRSDIEFIDEFGHPAVWKTETLCLPCSTKQTETR